MFGLNRRCGLVVAAFAIASTGMTGAVTGLGGSAAFGSVKSSAVSTACAAIQKKYPSVTGKSFSVGIDPSIPGYETIDPKDPTKLVGFDVELLAAVSACAGYSTTFSKAPFPTLVPTLQSGRTNMVISNLIETPARAQQVSFVIYQRDLEGLIVAKGNPLHITSVAALCGLSMATFPGTVQLGAAQAQSKACVAEGKKPIKIETYADFSGCLEAMLTGRTDSLIQPISVVQQSVAAHPTKISGTPPILQFRNLIGMGFNKKQTDLEAASLAALKIVQSKGTEMSLLTKWKIGASQQATASLIP